MAKQKKFVIIKINIVKPKKRELKVKIKKNFNYGNFMTEGIFKYFVIREIKRKNLREIKQ